MNRSSRRGFTLIELLLAVSIMSGVLILAGTAYQLYTSTWKRDLAAIDQVFFKFKFNALWVDAVKAVIPLSLKASSESNAWGFYFLGREEGFSAVTSSPLFNPGYPAVIRIFREQTDDGRYRLVYEEASMRNMVLVSADQNLPFSHRQILLSNLPNLSFSYYGWPSLDDKMSANTEVFGPQTTRSWFNDYDGMQRRYQPDTIRITAGNQNITINLPNRSSLSLRRGLTEDNV